MSTDKVIANVKKDLAGESGAIKQYKKHIKTPGLPKRAKNTLKAIRKDEMDHHKKLTSVLKAVNKSKKKKAKK
jgi:rubrerythrin